MAKIVERHDNGQVFTATLELSKDEKRVILTTETAEFGMEYRTFTAMSVDAWDLLCSEFEKERACGI